MGGRKMTKIGCFDPPRPPPGTPQGGPRGGVPGGPRGRAARSARNFNLVLISPLGFAFSDRNPTKLTKNTKKVSFGPNSALNDMNFSVWTKTDQNWPNFGHFGPPGTPPGTPQTPYPPPGTPPEGSGPKKHEIFDFPGKNAFVRENSYFFDFFALLGGLSGPFSLYFPNWRVFVPIFRHSGGFFCRKRVPWRVFFPSLGPICVFSIFLTFLKKTRKKNTLITAKLRQYFV